MPIEHAQLEPAEECPPGKTRLYSNFDELWPIRPRLYFTKLAVREIERRQRYCLTHEATDAIAVKMAKRFPEMGYTAEMCGRHWKNVSTKVRLLHQMLLLGVDVDPIVGLITTPLAQMKKLLRGEPLYKRQQMFFFINRNLLDYMKLLQVNQMYGMGHRAHDDGEEEDDDDEEQEVEEQDVELEQDDEEEYESDTPPQPRRGINIVLPVSRDDVKFNIEEFNEIAHKDTQQLTLYRPKHTSMKKRRVREAQRACYNCESYHIPCTFEEPSCARCTFDGVECEYPIPGQPRKRRKREEETMSEQEACMDDHPAASSVTSFDDAHPGSMVHISTPPLPPRQPLAQFYDTQSYDITPEEADRRKHAVERMLVLLNKGHFSEGQFLDYVKDLITFSVAEDFYILEKVPDPVLARIMRVHYCVPVQ